VQTVSENDKDPPTVVIKKPAPIDEYWTRVLNVKNAAGQKNVNRKFADLFDGTLGHLAVHLDVDTDVAPVQVQMPLRRATRLRSSRSRASADGQR